MASTDITENEVAPSAGGSSGRRRRRRSIPVRLSFDYCQTCRDRKLKCDGERPSCRRCVAAKRVCKGYTIWELDLHNTPAPPENVSIPQVVNEGPSNRVQLLSKYLRRHYPDEVLAAPSAAHAPKMSFLHHLAGSEVKSAMLRSALETLCLSQLVDTMDSEWMRTPLQESYIRSLALLRTSLVQQSPLKPCAHRRDIIATSVALSLMPTSLPDFGQRDNSPSIHLVGASAYLREHGPCALAQAHGNNLDLPLLFNIHVYSMYCAFVRRKRVRWTQPEWQAVEQIMVDPKPDFPAASRFLLGSEVYGSDFVLCSFDQRDFMLNFVHQIPGLLERVDNIVGDGLTPSSQELDEDEFTDLVVSLNRMQRCHIEPIHDGNLSHQTSLISCNDTEVLDMNIEEQTFLYQDTTFKEFYRFASVEDGWNCAFVHQLCLLADCALLQVLHTNLAQETPLHNPPHIRMIDIQQRAYWHASEMCRCTLFYSQRSLTAAKFFHGLLQCTANFFESYGAVREATWCHGCSAATQRRIERIGIGAPQSLCRLGDMIAELPSRCCYNVQ